VKKFILTGLIITILVSAAGCSRSSGQEVVVYTSVDQVFSEPVFRAFEQASGIHLIAVFDTEETKSTGVLNRLIAESKSPQADVFWSGDPVRPFLLMNRSLVEPYISPQSYKIPPEFRSSDGSWTGFAARARVLLVNRETLKDNTVPRSIWALADSRWRGKAAIANPLYGTTTMHVAAWFSLWGEEKAKAFLNALKENQVRIAGSNGEVRRLVVSGEVTFGLTDSDDAFEAQQSGAPVEVVYPDQDDMGTLVMPTVVLLLHGGPNPEPARRLVDYLLSNEVETALAKSAAHMPLRPDVASPGNVRAVGAIRTMKVDYADVAVKMEGIQPWLRKWSGL